MSEAGEAPFDFHLRMTTTTTQGNNHGTGAIAVHVVKTLERGEATSHGSTQEPIRPDTSMATMTAAVATTTLLMQRRLDVSRVTDEGMDAVAKAVATKSSLCEADFRINRVTDGGSGDDQHKLPHHADENLRPDQIIYRGAAKPSLKRRKRARR